MVLVTNSEVLNSIFSKTDENKYFSTVSPKCYYEITTINKLKHLIVTNDEWDEDDNLKFKNDKKIKKEENKCVIFFNLIKSFHKNLFLKDWRKRNIKIMKLWNSDTTWH